MPKPKGPDYMKFIPIGVLVVGFISGYATLKAEASNSSEKIKAIEVVQTQLSGDVSDVKVSVAKIEGTMAAMYEAVKDLKKK